MTFYDYEASKRLAAGDYPFYALVMAAFRQADTHNTQILRLAWPKIWREFEARYNAPGGRLESDPAKS